MGDTTKNNIVFFLNDNDTTFEEGEEYNKLGATGCVVVNPTTVKEKFIKTQKIEFSSKDKVTG